MNIVAVRARTNGRRTTGWSPSKTGELAHLYSDFHRDVLAIIAATTPGALFKWSLHDREPLPSWNLGRVSLLGDAPHPFTPFLGQGVCMAIEDGTVLGRCFAKIRDPIVRRRP